MKNLISSDSSDVRASVAAVSRLQWLMVLASLAVATGILVDGISDVRKARKDTRRHVMFELDRAADRTLDFFEDIHADLLMIVIDPRVQAFDPSVMTHIQSLFDHERERWRMSELYFVRHDFDGQRRPAMAFEVESHGFPEEEIHSLEREEQEYDLLVTALRRFAQEPDLHQILSGEIDLCLPNESGQQLRGLVYAVPIRANGELLGAVAAMIPTTFLDQLLVPVDWWIGAGFVDLDHGSNNHLLGVAGQLSPALTDGILTAVRQNRGFKNSQLEAVVRDMEPTPGRTWSIVALYRETSIFGFQTGPLRIAGMVLMVVLTGGVLAYTTGINQRRLNEKLRRLDERHRWDDTMRSIVVGTAAVVGEAYLENLVRHVATSFGMQLTLVGELLDGNQETIRTMAVWNGDDFAANFEFDLANTPCESLFTHDICFFGRAVQERFPENPLLSDLGVESFLGVPIRGTGGDALGILALFGDHAIDELPEGAESILTVFAARAAAEIERLRADEAKHQSQALSSSIVETIGDGIVVLDRDYRIVLFNRAMEQLSGLSRDEVGKMAGGVWEVFPHLQTDRADEGIRAAFQGEVVTRERRAYQLINGRSGISTEVYHPLRDKQNRVTGLVCVIRDVTREIEVEDRLQQAQRLEAIGTLAAGIAHDFNNILQVILGFAEMAGQDVDANHPVTGSLEEILMAGRRGARLARQILNSSRSKEEERSQLDLVPLIKETLVLLRSSLPSTIEIRQRLDQTCGQVRAHPAEIHRIIMNMSTNAFQAMRENGGTLTVELNQVDELGGSTGIEAGKYASLVFTDTGPGMDEFTAERVFEPYFTTRARGEGTGLGLATVHGMVTSAGGTVRLETSPGSGASFTVLLPIVDPDDVGEPTTSAPISVAEPTRTQRILVVDDEAKVLWLMVSTLERLGFEVVGKANGGDALAEFQETPRRYQLVITDLTMPGLVGTELAEEIHLIDRDVPVILCSGWSDEIPSEVLSRVGITSVLTKPVALRDLEAAVNSVLSRKE